MTKVIKLINLIKMIKVTKMIKSAGEIIYKVLKKNNIFLSKNLQNAKKCCIFVSRF